MTDEARVTPMAGRDILGISGRDLIWLPKGDAFDLSGDLTGAAAACRNPEGLATAIGMLTAIAGDRSRTSGFEKAVYVIQAGDKDICKIGVSANPIQRLAELQGSHYEELSLHAVVFCPKRNAVAIERGILSAADSAGTRLKGEWLEGRPEAVLNTVLCIARDNNFPVCDGATWFKNMVSRTKQLARNGRRPIYRVA